MKRKFMKFVLVIPALTGLFLLASAPDFVAKAYVNTFQAMADDEIKVDKTAYDFGTVRESDGLISTVFTIMNNSANPIVITYVGTSCGCTATEWTKKPIEAGKTGKVTVSYNPTGRLGAFDKTITIMTTGSPDGIIVRITGTVI